MTNQQEKARAFKAMHTTSRGFVMPNAWDAGSAVLLAQEDFTAIATTSAGIAFSLGRPDYQSPDPRISVTRETMFARIREIVEAVPIPVSGDLEDGYGPRPEDVVQTIRLAIEAGLAGGNIEDRDRRGADVLFDETLAVDRIKAARAAIDASGNDFVLVARTDAFLLPGGDGLRDSIRRGNLFRAAGADCIYPPGPADIDMIRTLVKEIDAPVNIVLGLGALRASVGELLDAGVGRISLGGSIARAALGFVRNAARELAKSGTNTFAAVQIGQGELNTLFAQAHGFG
jgi:2-methylisocitrate lyase-like PEP mutase family enzyme